MGFQNAGQYGIILKPENELFADFFHPGKQHFVESALLPTPIGIVPTLLSLLTDINNPFLSFNSNIYKVYLNFIIPRFHPPWWNRGPWGREQGCSLPQGGACLFPPHTIKALLLFNTAFPPNRKQIQHCSGLYKAKGFWRTVCPSINQGKRMSFRRYCMIILNRLKKNMTPSTRKSTANTGLYE